MNAARAVSLQQGPPAGRLETLPKARRSQRGPCGAGWAGWDGGGSPARACTPKCRFRGGPHSRGSYRFQVISPDNGHPEVWGRLLADTGGDFSAQDPGSLRRPALLRLGQAVPVGGTVGRGRGAGRSRQIQAPAARRGGIARACRQRAGPGGSSSRPASAAQCAGAAGRFPRATAGAAAGLSASLRHGRLRGAGSAGLRGAPQPRHFPAGRLGARAAAAHARRPAGPHRAGAVRGRAQRIAAAALPAAALPGAGRTEGRGGDGARAGWASRMGTVPPRGRPTARPTRGAASPGRVLKQLRVQAAGGRPPRQSWGAWGAGPLLPAEWVENCSWRGSAAAADERVGWE